MLPVLPVFSFDIRSLLRNAARSGRRFGVNSGSSRLARLHRETASTASSNDKIPNAAILEESQHEQNNLTNRAFCPVRTCPRGAEPCHSNARNGRKDTGTDGGVYDNVSHGPDSSARTNG